MSERRHVLVTGANGFVGTRVARRLASAGDRVRALVRRPGEIEDLRAEGIEEMAGDFTDPATAADAVKGVTHVVHSAATVGEDLESARRVNTHGTRVVAAAALAAGVPRFVHVSTVAVYDAGDRNLVEEDCPLATEGHQYSVSKAEGEGVVRELEEEGLKAVILRPGAILGAHPTSTWSVKIPTAVKKREHRLLVDGLNVMPFVHVENVVDAVVTSLDSKSAVGRAYNLVDEHVTWLAFTDEIRSWFGTEPLDVVPREEIPEGAYSTREYSNRRAREELRYRVRLTYADGMKETAEYWKERLAAEAASARS